MKSSYIYAAVAILCRSTVATVAKLLLGQLTSMQVLFVSSFFAFAFLLGAVSYGIYTALNQKKHYDKRLSMMFFYPASFIRPGDKERAATDHSEGRGKLKTNKKTHSRKRAIKNDFCNPTEYVAYRN